MDLRDSQDSLDLIALGACIIVSNEVLSQSHSKPLAVATMGLCTLFAVTTIGFSMATVDVSIKEPIYIELIGDQAVSDLRVVT